MKPLVSVVIRIKISNWKHVFAEEGCGLPGTWAE